MFFKSQINRSGQNSEALKALQILKSNKGNALLYTVLKKYYGRKIIFFSALKNFYKIPPPPATTC